MCKTYTQTRLPDARTQVHILTSPSPSPSCSPTLWPTKERAGGKAGGEPGQDVGRCILKNPILGSVMWFLSTTFPSLASTSPQWSDTRGSAPHRKLWVYKTFLLRLQRSLNALSLSDPRVRIIHFPEFIRFCNRSLSQDAGFKWNHTYSKNVCVAQFHLEKPVTVTQRFFFLIPK